MKTLLIEDNEVHAMLTRYCLRREDPDGHVRWARSGRDGIEVLREASQSDETRPDLILLDINMKELDGHEVLKRIRSDPKTHAIPIAMFTSSTDPHDQQRARELNADAYVIKPIEKKQFFEMAKSLIQHQDEWKNQHHTPHDMEVLANAG